MTYAVLEVHTPRQLNLSLPILNSAICFFVRFPVFLEKAITHRFFVHSYNFNDRSFTKFTSCGNFCKLSNSLYVCSDSFFGGYFSLNLE